MRTRIGRASDPDSGETTTQVVLAIPISLSAAPLVFAYFGFTFNIITLLALIVVVATQVLGYFAGDAAMKALAASGRPGMSGMLAWGICYGVGFGAGLGWLVQACEPDQSQGDVG